MPKQLSKNEAIEATQIPDENHFSKCMKYAVRFVKKQKCKFTSEDCIHAYKKTKNPQPKEPRVWGKVFTELIKAGFIKHAGFGRAKNTSAHGKPINIWKAIA